MPKSLADAKKRVNILPAPAAAPEAVTVTEATAGIYASCRILASDFKLGPTGSDTVNEKALCDKGNVAALGASNYAGSMTAFRYFDATTKQVDVAEDEVFQAVMTKGSTIYLLVRNNAKDADEQIAADDEYVYAECETDEPQEADATGYIKYIVPLSVKKYVAFKKVVAP